MPSPFTHELLDRIVANQESGTQPLLFGNALIVTGDSLIGDFDRGDILLGADRVVGVGPGLLTAADDDGAIVIDCDGYAIVPAVVDTTALLGLRADGYRSDAALAPGHQATFAILSVSVDETAAQVTGRFLSSPQSADVVVIDGVVARWADSVVTQKMAEVPSTGTEPATSEDRLGTWIDENDFVHQHLTADGRYDETRGGRPHAFQGSYWIDGNRIDYRDDLGFWAFGEFVDETLHHAGYTFHRS
jgi:imidazolonepropionase-like amidohydrolase